MGSEAKRPGAPTVGKTERRLAAILHADVHGYSRRIHEDEAGTLQVLTPALALLRTLVEQHGGRAVGSRGDSLLAEFPSVVEAVQCAVEMQRELKAKSTDLPEHKRLAFRIGISLGEIVIDGEQPHGDGINIAVRIEALAAPGGICISDIVYHQVKTKLPFQYQDLGEQQLKNIPEAVRVWRIVLDGSEGPQSEVQSAKVNGERQKPRWVGTSVFVSVLVSVLLLGGLVILWSFFPSSFRIPYYALRTQEAQPPSLPLPDKPSIVVLPFVNLSGDPEQEYFSDGITEVLTSNLSQISSLFVIARNSAFFYKGKRVKIQDISRELGVRHMLEGSVQKAGERVRIIAQLIDATTGGHLWSEQYDRSLQDIFALQDEIRQKIVFALKVKLLPEEQERFKRAPTQNMEAYDYYLRGLESLLRGWNERKKELLAQARQMFEKAIELDPRYAGAHAWLGWTYFLDWFYGWNRDRAQIVEQAFALAQRAVALDDSLSLSHQILGRVSVWKKQHEQAITEGERAIALDPNEAEGYVALGTTLAFAGRPEEGIGLIEKAMRLNPQYPPYYLNLLGFAYRTAGRCEEAIAPLQKAITLSPDLIPAHGNLAICYVELGQLEKARVEIAEVLRLSPNVSLESQTQNMPYKDPADLERYINGLRKAGLK
jgi:adenylate cyclase